MFAVVLLLAEAEAPRQTGGMLDMLPLIAIFVAFYLLVLMPMNRDRQNRARMIGNLKRNDRVEINGFLIGTVAQILKAEQAGGLDELLIKVEDGAKLRVLKSSVTRVIKSSDEAKDGGA